MSAGEITPPRPAPRTPFAVWARANLFATPLDSVVTLVMAALLLWLGWSLMDWAVLKAVWVGESKAVCRSGGACWALITARWPQVLAGFYPAGHRWRVVLAAVLLAVAVVPVLLPRAPKGTVVLAPLGVVLAFAVLGGAGVLPRVPTDYWGGAFLNVLIGVTGAVFALPFGVLLALGRRSKLPVIKALSVAFIEIVRGAPLITLLVVASVVLPLFLPEGVSFERLTRAMVVITLFESAYMAEVVRGGLRAIPKGQTEAARALGLDPLRIMGLVILPQALKLSIPAIVNTFIGLFKDTTLVYVIAILEVTGTLRQATSDYAWQGRDLEAYGFVALMFWVACFAMSRFAASLERRGVAGSLTKTAEELK